MSAIDYLIEDGLGAYARWHVPDLVPAGGPVELVFVFESPHVDELRSRLPVVGSAGQSALRFLLSREPRGRGLGHFVKESHDAGSTQVAVVNVCRVPMQRAAFVHTEVPGLGAGEWTLIERARRSRARSISAMRNVELRDISEALADGLRARLSAVPRGPQGRIVVAGVFAQRMVGAALPSLEPHPLQVPHPSFNQWNRVANLKLPDLVEMRQRFAALLSTP